MSARSAPGPDRDYVLLLEARVIRRPAIPLLREALQCRVELGLAPGLARVRLGCDRRPVARLEVLDVVARALEGRDLEHVAIHRPELDARAEQLGHVLLAAPQRRGLRAGWRCRGERAHRAEERADHAF